MKKSFPKNDILNENELKGIASRITYLRNDILHMTQQEFCTILNMSQTYLSLIENGKKQIQKTTIDKILITFKVNIEWLIYGIGTDEDIFLSGPVTKDYFTKVSQNEVFSDLQKVYQLKERDVQFLQWYLNLPSSARSSFHSITDKLQKLISSYPPGSL